MSHYFVVNTKKYADLIKGIVTNASILYVNSLKYAQLLFKNVNINKEWLRLENGIAQTSNKLDKKLYENNILIQCRYILKKFGFYVQKLSRTILLKTCIS